MLSTDFGALLESVTTEEAVHSFLVAHEVIWRAALPRSDRILSKPSLHRFVPDFAAGFFERTQQWWRWTLVEIEAPGDPLFLRRGDPSAKLTHAVKQIADWRNWISENTAYARTILPDISTDCRGLVIMGRRREITKDLAANMRAYQNSLSKIEIHTYDWLLDIIVEGIEKKASWGGPLYQGNDWQCGLGWGKVGD